MQRITTQRRRSVEMTPLENQPNMLPCPFCGVAPKAFVEPGQRTAYQIECRGPCQVHPSVFGYDLNLIVGDWNRRAPLANSMERLLKEAIKIIHCHLRNTEKDWLTRARAALRASA
jgi:hypothetical protein